MFGLSLPGVNTGVDLEQFSWDEAYKRSIVLTLARSSDSRLFSTSVSLGRRHGIDMWEVHVTLLDALLTTSKYVSPDYERGGRGSSFRAWSHTTVSSKGLNIILVVRMLRILRESLRRERC